MVKVTFVGKVYLNNGSNNPCGTSKRKLRNYTKNKNLKIMKKIILITTLTIALFSCSKNDDTTNTSPINPNVTVKSRIVTAAGFNYKEFYQETANSSNRKGLIILAVGDGGNENDGTLNEQCTALAQEGYIAITTTYRTSSNWNEFGSSFKADIELVISNAGTLYNIPRSKTIVGGLSRGGNMTMALILPNGQFEATTPFEGIKGAIFECSGGDAWKGSSVLFPVAWMSNKVDDVMGVTNANDFKTGLTTNSNPNVNAQSECLIYSSSGHCADISGNKAFIVKKVKEWLP